MAELNRNIIKNLSSDELAYNRGVRYYKNKAIKTISKSKSKDRYRATIQGKSEYTVDIDLTEKKPSYQCNCPASRKYSGACKHSIAVMLFINDYKDKNKQNNIESDDERRVIQLLDYFDKMDYIVGMGELFSLKLEIHIPSMLKENNDSKVRVSLSAGNSRFYKIQNVRKFLSDYRDGENIILGKEFTFFHGESRFDSHAEEILNFLVEILSIQEIAGKGNSTSFFQKNEVILDLYLFYRLLNITKQPFSFSFGEKNFEEVIFKKGQPDLNFYLNLSEEDDSILLSWEKGKIVPLDEKGSLFFYENVIYHTKKIFTRHFLPFYSLSQNKKEDALIFTGEDKERFLASVLPRIHETFNLTIPETLKNQYITSDAIFFIFLDLEKNTIKLEIKVEYGGYRFNPFDKMPDVKAIIVRQPSRESDCFDMVESLGFIREGQFFYLRKEEDIYYFLTDKIKGLSSNYEIFYSKDFSSLSINKPKLQKTSVGIKGDNNLLEIDFSFQNISKEELGELFLSLKLKKKYFRLKNGSFIDLSKDKEVSNISELFENVKSEMEGIKDGKIYTSVHHAFYLNQVLGSGKYKMETDASFHKLMDEINTPNSSIYPVPENINAELHPYQKIGFHWLLNLKKYNLSGILADDMGLGKTLQSITYMSYIIKETPEATFLVVCPSSLLFNWEDEIASFCPSLKSLIILGNPEERRELLLNYKNYQIILVSYPIIRRDIELLSELNFHTVFLDEAQFIKNPGSLNARAVKSLKAEHRFALTGTPIENNLTELWSIFDFLMPGYLHSHSKFINQYEKPVIKFNDEKALKKLSFHIKPFILRRMKKDVLKELPEKIEKKMVSDMTDSQKEIYLSYLQEFKEKVTTEINEKGFEKSRIMILSYLTRLRQICCHPSTFIENTSSDSGKLNLLLQVIENGISNGHRILIFSQFTSMLKIIENELQEKNISYFYLDGNTAISERGEEVKKFNNGEKDIFLVSLKAGGTGLNLVGADMVIHYDPWWNPAVEEQATDRVYRIGQKNKVTVIKLITKGTIEEKIYKLQDKKRNLADSVIKSGEVFINKLTKEEVEDLFKY